MSPINVDQLKDAIKRTLIDHLKDMEGDLIENWQDIADQILSDTAAMAAGAQNEDQVAIENLRDLEAQAELMARTIALRESKRVIETVKRVITVSLQVLGRAAINALAG
jgi:hypothetical protein